MASMAKPQPVWVPMTAEELLVIRGTPEFEAELRRQAMATAEADRKNGYPNRFEPDWEWLDRYWK